MAFKMMNSLDNPDPLLDIILGVTVFDPNGLTKESFVVGEHRNYEWLQASFQTLGLQFLVSSLFQFEPAAYAIAHGCEHNVILVRQQSTHAAFLVHNSLLLRMDETVLSWFRNFDSSQLRGNPKFFAV